MKGNYSDAFVPVLGNSADFSFGEVFNAPLSSQQIIRLIVPNNMPSRRMYKAVSIISSNANDWAVSLRYDFWLNSNRVYTLEEGFANSAAGIGNTALKKSLPNLTTGDWEPVQHAAGDIRLCYAGYNAAAGETGPIVVLHPFPVNITADLITVGVAFTLNVTSIYRLWFGVISDQGYGA